MATLPTFSSLYLTVNNATLSRDTPDEQLSNWEQSMSIQDGLVRTSYDWTPEGATAPLRVSYQMLAHRVWPNVAAVRLTVQGLNTSDQVAFTDVFDVRHRFPRIMLPAGLTLPVPSGCRRLAHRLCLVGPRREHDQHDSHGCSPVRYPERHGLRG